MVFSMLILRGTKKRFNTKIVKELINAKTNVENIYNRITAQLTAKSYAVLMLKK